MKQRKQLATCTEPGCPNLTRDNKCDTHKPIDTRPNAAARGYDARWQRDRKLYLQAHPTCILCGRPSEIPDHHPHSRADLVAAGVKDPDAWQHLRPLCTPCHNRETAKHQPGGWHQGEG